MNSQVKWGLAFIIIGVIITPFAFPFLLIYTVPLILIGLGLMFFRKREETIEDTREESQS